jgi:protocatechuate 3,4-dioxygenase, alpha subunit
VEATPSQTVGPFFSIGLCRRPASELASPDDPRGLRLIGRLLDGDGMPIADGVIEAWDADRRRWGRCGTDADGRFAFVVAEPAGDSPHLDLCVHARGLLRHQLTRVYFPGAADDALLGALEPGRRATLVAEAEDGALRFDIRLQGEGETVFFEH